MSGLESEYKGKARGQNLDATVLWKEPDHEVKMEDVRRELDRLLSK